MRVLLSPSYQLELDPKQAANREPYPPLGTLYAAARLRADGHEVALSDSMLALGMTEYRKDLERFRPELVAIYEDDFNYLSKMCLTNMRDAAFEKARLAKAAGARVVVHGSDASDHLEGYLRESIDFAVLGEGEETLSDLVRLLERDGSAVPRDGVFNPSAGRAEGESRAALSPSGGRAERVPERERAERGERRALDNDKPWGWGPAALKEVPGIAYLDDAARVVKTASRPFLRDLDELPLPAWDLVDVERYRSAWLERHDYFSVNMVTTRGCPYHCNWCAKPIYGQRYQLRSPASVAEELSWMRQVVRPDHIWFADDIFGLRPGWVEAFASEVEARGARTPFKMQARADLIDEKVADALARAGCENVWMGAESGSQKVLDAMDKGIRVEQIFQATRLLRRQNIRVSFFLQFGYPGEDWSDIQKTLELVRGARPDDIGISVSYPLPGTRFFERVQRELTGKANWKHSDDLDLMFRGAYPPDFYRALYRMVHSDFRLRRELRRLPHPRSVARSVHHFARYVSARIAVRSRSRRKNPALP